MQYIVQLERARQKKREGRGKKGEREGGEKGR